MNMNIRGLLNKLLKGSLFGCEIREKKEHFPEYEVAI